MNKSKSKASKKRAPLKSVVGFDKHSMLIGGGVVIFLALISWVLWPNGPDEGNKNFVDGGDINQPVKEAKPRTVLWDRPSLVLSEEEDNIDQYDPTLSTDELTLIFVQGRAHRDVGANLYQVRRASISDPWGDPELLSEINTSHNEISPELSRDGQRLFFSFGEWWCRNPP